MNESPEAYRWASAATEGSHSYLLPTVSALLNKHADVGSVDRRLFDLGCGNGSASAELSKLGWKVTGVDPSAEGISQATQCYPNLNLSIGSAYDDLFSRFGHFPAVISLEVVEHVYFPRKWASTLFQLVAPGGVAVVSTPYHGYLKNLAMALSGRLDSHFTALWDHGHIKFWSVRTLTELLSEAGFEDIAFCRVGRVPPLAKSMIAVCRRRASA